MDESGDRSSDANDINNDRRKRPKQSHLDDAVHQPPLEKEHSTTSTSAESLPSDRLTNTITDTCVHTPTVTSSSNSANNHRAGGEREAQGRDRRLLRNRKLAQARRENRKKRTDVVRGRIDFLRDQNTELRRLNKDLFTELAELGANLLGSSPVLSGNQQHQSLERPQPQDSSMPPSQYRQSWQQEEVARGLGAMPPAQSQQQMPDTSSMMMTNKNDDGGSVMPNLAANPLVTMYQNALMVSQIAPSLLLCYEVLRKQN